MLAANSTARLTVRRPAPQRLLLELGGDWVTGGDLPGAHLLDQEVGAGTMPETLEFDARALGKWNSGLLSYLLRCHAWCRERHIEFRADGLPAGAQRLLRLSAAVPERKAAPRTEPPGSRLHRIGTAALAAYDAARDMVTFLGETALAFLNLLRGRAQFQWSEALAAMQECGPRGLGIVALISFLVGLILAFVGSVQLARFGASVYVADLVAIGVVREMGCIMTGIIVCGRTGAAFAAELGTMKVSEEIDAFHTFAISSMEYLVLPRVLALVIMIPVLCVFADLIAILGGFTVSVYMLDVQPAQYLDRTLQIISVSSFLLGLVKGAVFGLLVALTGCFRGMRCGTDAAAVGRATTSAVVTGITSIVVADGVFAVLCNALGI